MRTLATIGFGLILITPVHAGIEVQFDEGAPKDRFTVSATGGCSLGPMTVTIDLAPSPYGLIFDTTGSGAGVEVFQPFELTAGREALTSVPTVRDGDNQIQLDVKTLRPGEAISFTIDVDDTAQSREITVSNSEITGARVIAQKAGDQIEAPFGANAIASLPMTDCVS